ncbi:zinc binding dehydrogenase [Legionella quinlivanii]|uniref:Zinc-type alcohol dehydrogenase-like protein n=1 Tax=Legionella quinlivanii TaxID=45073 RepID=A0A0W0XZ60_9GAMM|nr:zinc-binding alcohol dehydrogenase family protein [Legionella quinlivanii]KTD50024.1 zinc binding dehydrogenase [Legionella quinlivanii]MCW8450632.1 zinc-binding alcohol dehydrogenase family protein [Legionella quinlivanii]SEF94320.1 zinc-binding alcohol dehydrogenase family protein [Legionella quinlivanii DSM 21216]STY11200.1 NADPH-quinone reductase and Zn-dependent oxidoreductase [Legionella quinlivanii]
MKAIGYKQAGMADVLEEIELPMPEMMEHDLLVEVRAIAVNPIDTKVRSRTQPENSSYKILGWDAVGIVKDIGSKVSLFKKGDTVWYAGDLTRPGCNSEFHLIDERIAALKPQSLSNAEAAAMPLTTLTAWELLFDRLQIDKADTGTLLITGAAGGVGSILVQLARQLTSLTIIGTGSRPESSQWIKANGAHHVISHQQSLSEQLQQLGISEVDYVISLTHTDEHAAELIKCLKPQGKFALIDNPESLDIKLFKLKSISIHWEMMYTRSMFKTPDMIKQHQILSDVAKMVDAGTIKTTLNENLGKITAANLQQAHRLLESGKSVGKIVLEGFH